MGVMSSAQGGLALSMGVIMIIYMSVFFEISSKTRAGYMQSMDPAYPFLQAVAMHHVDGKPFLHYLSLALKENREDVEGVNVKGELEKFREEFRLLNQTGGEVTRTEGPARGASQKELKEAHFAVPPRGYLVMVYEWS